MRAARAVDSLPARLWSVGNIYLVFGHRVHLCLGDGKRTVEVDGREVARGSKPLVSAHGEADARLAEVLWSVDIGWVALAGLGLAFLALVVAGQSGSTRRG